MNISFYKYNYNHLYVLVISYLSRNYKLSIKNKILLGLPFMDMHTIILILITILFLFKITHLYTKQNKRIKLLTETIFLL